MAYLIAQIFVCLLLAALLGGLIGWLLRGRGRAAAPDAGALGTATQRIADLERELAACRRSAPAADASTSGTLGTGLAASAAGFVSGAALHSDTAPPAVAPPTPATPSATAGQALFGTPAAAPVDDLEAISGIGPVIATQLAGIGVTTFRQIARFTPEDVARVNDALGVFQGRIGREDWTGQAARLHQETYGSDA